MDKKKAEEEFEELKKNPKSAKMQLSEVMSLLTNGIIPTAKAQQFLEFVLQNQFGEHSNVYEYVEKSNWKQLTFPQVYLILKHYKVYFKKQKPSNQVQEHPSEKGAKQLISSFDSKHSYNHTIEEIIQNLKPKEETAKTEQIELENYDQKWKQMKFKLVKKLLIIFDFLRKSMHIEGETFEKNQHLSEHMNLTMFMRYVKIFELANTFKPHKIMKAFKTHAVNTLWLDFDRFVNTNFTIINFSENISSQDKYLRLKGLVNLVSSENIKKMLNVRGKTVLATIVEGHTGTYKQDILDFLQEKLKERKLKEEKRWNGKRFKTQSHSDHSNENKISSLGTSIVKVNSSKSLSSRVHTEKSISIYQQLKLPSLRIKQSKNQSIYQSLKKLDLRDEKQKLKNLINVEENQQYLDIYLKEEAKLKQKKHKRPKKLYELPPMKFS